MAGRGCGCASDRCSCTVTGGTGIVVTGTGSDTNPYEITATGEGTHVVGSDAGGVDMTVTGTGTFDDPIVVNRWCDDPAADVGDQRVHLVGYLDEARREVHRRAVCVGAGGGGAGGARGTVLQGGGGGGGGAYTSADLAISDLGASVGVVVGGTSAGGLATTATNTAGGDGAAGGATNFGYLPGRYRWRAWSGYRHRWLRWYRRQPRWLRWLGLPTATTPHRCPGSVRPAEDRGRRRRPRPWRVEPRWWLRRRVVPQVRTEPLGSLAEPGCRSPSRCRSPVVPAAAVVGVVPPGSAVLAEPVVSRVAEAGVAARR